MEQEATAENAFIVASNIERFLNNHTREGRHTWPMNKAVGMRFLDSARVLSNMRLATNYLLGNRTANKSLKEGFIEGINIAQSTPIHTLNDDIFIDFDNSDLVGFLIKKAVFSPEDVVDGALFLSKADRSQIHQNILAAQDLLARVDCNLHRLITALIGSVAVYRIPARDGSIPSCIGVIWISPSQDWKIEDYAENLLHEFVHNSVFLEDMVRGIMPNTAFLKRKEAFTTSVVRNIRRPYNKAFDSACVVAAIMYFYHVLGNDAQAESYIPPMQRTIEELYEHDKALHEQGLEVLAENGREILRELQQFIEGPNYSMIARALAHW